MIISVRADEAILFTSAAEVDGSTHAAIRLSGRMSGIRSWILRSSPEGSLVRIGKRRNLDAILLNGSFDLTSG